MLHHVRPRARITGYLARYIDLSREGCVVEMTPMNVVASPSCNYYPHSEAYVPIITVVDPALAKVSTRHLLRARLHRVREQLVVQGILDDIHDERNEQTCGGGDLGELEKDNRRDGGVSATAISLGDPHKVGEADEPPYEGFPSRKAYLASLRSRRGAASRVMADCDDSMRT
jgi:hypothetical protein